MKPLEGKKDKLEREIEETSKLENHLEKEYDECTKKYIELSKELENLEEENNSILNNFLDFRENERELENKIKIHKRKMYELENSIDIKKKELIEKGIIDENDKELYSNNSNNVTDTSTELGKIQYALNEKAQTLFDIDAEVRSIQSKEQEIRQQNLTYVEEIERLRKQLSDLDNIRNQRLSLLERSHKPTYTAYQWLEKNRLMFKKHVFSPVLIEINPKNRECAAAVEAFTGSALTVIFFFFFFFFKNYIIILYIYFIHLNRYFDYYMLYFKYILLCCVVLIDVLFMYLYI